MESPLPLPLFSSPSLRITDSGAIAARMPDRLPDIGEQYRFHFDMAKCIGCKCCVVACNEQNGNPAAINWRRVGEIEGGWFPNTQRSYMSMGCNHCVEPRSEEHTSELQSQSNLVCRLLLEKKKKQQTKMSTFMSISH